MVYQSSIKEEEGPPSGPEASLLSPLPSLETYSSSSSEDLLSSNDDACNDNASSSPTQRGALSVNKKDDELQHDYKQDDIVGNASLRPRSMFNGSSFFGQLTIVLIMILSWYYRHATTDDNHQYEEEEEAEEVEDPWETWSQGFNFTKHRDYWISDEDLPEDIAEDLNSDNGNIQAEAMARRQIDPSKWETFGYWEIFHYFACSKTLESTRPVWSEELFRDTRDFYHDFVENDEASFIGIFRSTYQANEDVYNVSERAVPYQSGGEKGRGLKAARDIKQGEVIFKATNNTIIFNDGNSFRNFLFAMNERFSDPGMVCDILIWAWVQDMEGEIPFAGVVDLDNGNLLNDWGLGLGEECNEELGSDEQEKSRCHYVDPNVECEGAILLCFASKNISEGEELLGDYSDFVSHYSWTSLGL